MNRLSEVDAEFVAFLYSDAIQTFLAEWNKEVLDPLYEDLLTE